MVLLTSGRNGKDLIQNEGPRVLNRLYINFYDTQGQLTLHIVMESSQNSNSSKFLWLSVLHARMKIMPIQYAATLKVEKKR